MPAKPDLARSDPESLVRKALDRIVKAASILDSRWAVAGPVERGEMWSALRTARIEGQRVLEATPDPKPGQCAHTWFAVLDNVWDRCGLPSFHPGEHKAEYAVNADKARADA